MLAQRQQQFFLSLLTFMQRDKRSVQRLNIFFKCDDAADHFRLEGFNVNVQSTQDRLDEIFHRRHWRVSLFFVGKFGTEA